LYRERKPGGTVLEGGGGGKGKLNPSYQLNKKGGKGGGAGRKGKGTRNANWGENGKMEGEDKT